MTEHLNDFTILDGGMGRLLDRGTPRVSTTALALPEVQQMSDSAFTAAEVLT